MNSNEREGLKKNTDTDDTGYNIVDTSHKIRSMLYWNKNKNVVELSMNTIIKHTLEYLCI